MTFAVEFAPSAKADLLRLYEFLLERSETLEDLDTAQRAMDALDIAARVHLSRNPLIYRKAQSGEGLRRELLVPFGSSGYVLLYEIAGPSRVMVLAVRHQREEDYH